MILLSYISQISTYSREDLRARNHFSTGWTITKLLGLNIANDSQFILGGKWFGGSKSLHIPE